MRSRVPSLLVLVLLASPFTSSLVAQTTGGITERAGRQWWRASGGHCHRAQRADRINPSRCDRTGRFVLAALPPGEYQVRAELSGFRPMCAASSS